jgi:hypothetical protein
MSLLIVYLALMITGDIAAYLIGLVIERNAPAASLPAFLAMYFVFLWVAPGSLRSGSRLRGRSPNRAGAAAIRIAGLAEGPSAEARAGQAPNRHVVRKKDLLIKVMVPGKLLADCASVGAGGESRAWRCNDPNELRCTCR